ncbi:MAG: pyridoxal 5'-phosphate synthase glutaminase subunit PdxT [Candidatus Thermoplasmatota archaeon]|nr:pyridoxal 5'-phosphate synthase glutaminase subunit PdxT [Candidatus Thermoplasmatota archaeon]MCL5794102.1 pyridoxal 5'-phosphate synthase glutaminase subunit PdxT [Candidatus Thermoplasmatota archaeon]
MRIGIIGYQGDVSEHAEILASMKRQYKRDIEVVLVKSRESLMSVAGLIIPGGESTTIFRLLKEYSLFDAVAERVRSGMPVMGTCAGLILISRDNPSDRVRSLNLIDAKIRRNAYGRQGESFIESLDIDGIGRFDAVFIRAPIIESVGSNVTVMAKYNGLPVMIRDNNVLGLTFHPELTKDARIHDYFMDMIGRRGYVSIAKREWYVADLI